MLGKTLPPSYSPLLTFAFTEGLIEFPGKVLNLTRPPEYWDAGLYHQAGLTSLCRWDLPWLPTTPEFDLGSTFIEKVALENSV